MTARFRLVFLGGASIEGPEGGIGGRIAQPRSLAFLALLAGTRAGLTRDKILGYLWPSADTGQGRHLLNNTLYHVRRVLGADAVLGTGESLRLNRELVTTDTLELSDALARGDTALATELYRGAFLDGFYLADAPEFEHWVDRQRDSIARVHAEALESEVRKREGQGDRAGAAQWLSRLAATDPYNSRVVVRLAQTLRTTGDPAAAFRVLSGHAERLRGELALEPPPEVTALLSELQCTAPTISGVAPRRSTNGGNGNGAKDSQLVTTNTRATAPRSRRPWTVKWVAAAAAGLLLVVSTATLYARLNAGPPTLPGVAVLPFVNLTDSANAWFADGVHEDVLTQISRISALRVVSRTSVMAYRSPRPSLRQIARDLEVQYVVEGSVRRDSNRVLITVQLLDAQTDDHLWTEQYERKLADIFAIQAEIARRVAGALSARLTPQERRRLALRPTRSVTAYDYYLQGQSYSSRHRLRPDDSRMAVELFQRAIAADSTFASAYAALAITWAMAAWQGFVPRDRLDSALVAATTAVRLDPSLASARNALGIVYLNTGYSQAALQELEQAAALNSNWNAPATNIGVLHQRRGRYDEAIRWYSRSLQLDPVSPPAWTAMGFSYAALGLLPQAQESFEKALALRPDMTLPAAMLIRVHLASGERNTARALAERLATTHSGDAFALTVAGHAHLVVGDTATAKAYLQRAFAADSTAMWMADVRVLLAFVAIQEGHREQARDMLEAYVAATTPSPDPASWHPRHPGYSLAAAYALLGKDAELYRSLRAIDGGSLYMYYFVALDPLFNTVRDRAAFKDALRQQGAELNRMRLAVQWSSGRGQGRVR